MSALISGLLDPLLVLTHVMALLALGLLIGQQDAGRRLIPLMAFAAGLVAGLAAIAFLFVLLFRAGMRVSAEAPDAAGSLLALGLTMLIALQALINMGVVLGLFPTKGLPLPFVSYGGSAFMANCAAVGILLNIARAGARRIT